MDRTATERLTELKAEACSEWQRRTRERAAARQPARRVSQEPLWLLLVRAGLTVAVVVVLPFLVLIRGSVFLYQDRGYGAWLALAAGALLALAVVTLYAGWLSRKLTAKGRVSRMAKWVALPLVVGWCGYALVYLARVNAKTSEVRVYYTATHPLLRLALSTWILVDGDIVVTDLGREPPDYARMGLPRHDRTRHARQADGWVHAVDLRTRGRGAVANGLAGLYFRLMGFRTLRHVGTADHLHVELGLP